MERHRDDQSILELGSVQDTEQVVAVSQGPGTTQHVAERNGGVVPLIGESEHCSFPVDVGQFEPRQR